MCQSHQGVHRFDLAGWEDNWDWELSQYLCWTWRPRLRLQIKNKSLVCFFFVTLVRWIHLYDKALQFRPRLDPSVILYLSWPRWFFLSIYPKRPMSQPEHRNCGDTSGDAYNLGDKVTLALLPHLLLDDGMHLLCSYVSCDRQKWKLKAFQVKRKVKTKLISTNGCIFSCSVLFWVTFFSNASFIYGCISKEQNVLDTQWRIQWNILKVKCMCVDARKPCGKTWVEVE